VLLKSDLDVQLTGLCGGSKVVEQWTHEPKFEGSNQATEGTGRERKKTVTIVIIFSGVKRSSLL
jgi:hypothetical protein